MKRFYIFKDGTQQGSTHTKESAIEFIRQYQKLETHPVLKAQYSIIEGEEEFIPYHGRQSMAELRVCPFCGSNDIRFITDCEHEDVFLECHSCMTRGNYFGDAAAAIAAWNTRACDAEAEKACNNLKAVMYDLEKANAALRKKITALEDALERRELVRVPVPFGAPVYVRYMKCNEDYKQQNCHDASGKGCAGCPHRHPVALESMFHSDMLDDWGIHYFATREEAEAALEKEGQS